jgi:hypothetical protein
MSTYGKSEAQATAFLARLRRLTADEADAIAALRLPADDPDGRKAGAAVTAAVRESGRQDALAAIRERVIAWDRGWAGQPIVAFDLASSLRGMISGAELQVADRMHAAVPALLDAGGAIVVRDLIGADEYEMLAGPWEEVTGSGAGEPADDDA